MTSDADSRSIPGPPLGVPGHVWWALFLACGVASGLLGDTLWDEAVMVVFLVVGLVVLGVSRTLCKGDSASTDFGLTAFIVIYRGLLLGALMLGCAMLSWFLTEVLTRGRSGDAMLWFARLAIGLFLGGIVFLLLKKQSWPIREHARRALAWILGIGVLTVFTGFFAIFGPADLSSYPSATESPYRLPWKPGISRLCIQGNRTIISHWSREEFAYDFVMPVGTEICAARAGRVVEVVDHNDGNGPSAPGNHVFIFHEDGTHAMYAHIRKNGVLVFIGQMVEQGEVIALSGNVGVSTLPHVHFHVVRGMQTIPITFADVPGDGVPRMFRRHRSSP